MDLWTYSPWFCYSAKIPNVNFIILKQILLNHKWDRSRRALCPSVLSSSYLHPSGMCPLYGVWWPFPPQGFQPSRCSCLHHDTVSPEEEKSWRTDQGCLYFLVCLSLWTRTGSALCCSPQNTPLWVNNSLSWPKMRWPLWLEERQNLWKRQIMSWVPLRAF